MTPQALRVAFSVLSLATALSPSPALAEDAFTLPAGVFRLSLGSTSVSGNQAFGSGGQKAGLGAPLGAKIRDTGNLLNLATSNAFPGGSWSSLNPGAEVEANVFREDLALEYGLTPRLSLSAQVPLYLSASVRVTRNDDLNAALGILNAAGAPTAGAGKVGELFNKLSNDGGKAGTVGDLLFGAKYQFLHSGSSPVSTEPGSYRSAVALGFMPPTGVLASPDTNDLSTTTDQSRSWILGARTYWDYQFTSWFFLNLFTEHQYRFAGDAKHLDVNAATLAYRILDIRYQPGFQNRLELDFTFTPEILPGLQAESGLRVTGELTARGTVTGAPAGHESLVGQTQEASNLFNVVPYLGVFYQRGIPFKLKTSYYLPASGVNSNALSGMTFLLQGFLKF